MKPLSLYELNNLVRETLEQTFSQTFWVQAELSEVHVNNGHCYLELIQKASRGNSYLAKARGIIWANVFRLIKPYFEKTTGQAFTAGIQVLVEVEVQFHEVFGYSLVIHDIDPNYTLGDMARRRQEIIRQLEAEGVLTMNKELPFPTLPQRIAVISSATAAGYGDFCDQLKNNKVHYAFHTELFEATMQGEMIESTILQALDAIEQRREDFDVVVIIRGGGATSDLTGFDTYLLAAACAQFPLPIITGIGHERDETVLDLVANVHVKTPTAAAEYLITQMDNTSGHLEELSRKLGQLARNRIYQEKQRISELVLKLPSAVMRRQKQEHIRLNQLSIMLLPACQHTIEFEAERLRNRQQRFISASLTFMERRRHHLELLAQRIQDASPEKILARGYSITVCNGKSIKDATNLQKGDTLTTHFSKGLTISVVQETKTE